MANANRGGRKVYRSPRWELVRRAVLLRDKYRCTACSLPGRLEVHHVLPLDAGGAEYDLDNLQALCGGCHVAKHHPVDPEREAWKKKLAALAAQYGML